MEKHRREEESFTLVSWENYADQRRIEDLMSKAPNYGTLIL